jgi:hypothetical protein
MLKQNQCSSKYLEELLNQLSVNLEKSDKSLQEHLEFNKEMEEEWRLMDSKANEIKSQNPKITINLSGKKYITTADTLLNVKDTLFYRLITSGKFNLSNDLFFNRSPKYFDDILTYLRDKIFVMNSYSLDELDELYFEAQYYELTEILDKIGNRLNNITFTSFQFSGGLYKEDDKTVGTNNFYDLYSEDLSTGICCLPGEIKINFTDTYSFNQIRIGPVITKNWVSNFGENSVIESSIDGINYSSIGLIPLDFGSGIKEVKLKNETKANSLRFKSNGLIGIGFLEIKKIQTK